MPHFTLEYSSNLDGAVDFKALVRLIHATLLETGLVETGAVRVRAFRSDAYAIGDLLAENAFIDMSLRLGMGRSAEEKKLAGERIFAAVDAFLKDSVNPPHFALSLEIREIDRELSWKKNGLHGRLRTSAR